MLLAPHRSTSNLLSPRSMTRRSEIATPGFDDLDTVERYPELLDNPAILKNLNDMSEFMRDEVWRHALRGDARNSQMSKSQNKF